MWETYDQNIETLDWITNLNMFNSRIEGRQTVKTYYIINQAKHKQNTDNLMIIELKPFSTWWNKPFWTGK